MNFMSILTLSSICPVRKKRQIACSSVTNRARKDLKKKQNDPWKKLIQADLVCKSVSMIDFLQNRVMRIAFLRVINVQFNIFISIFFIL